MPAMSNVKNIVIISTHVIGEDNSVFPKEDGIYSSILADFFCDRYHLEKKVNTELGREPKIAQDFLQMAKLFLPEKDPLLIECARRIKNGEKGIVIKKLQETISSVAPDSPEKSTFMDEVNFYLQYEDKKKEEQKNCSFSESEAKKIKLPESKLKLTLYDVATLYEYNSDDKDSNPDFAVFAVRQLVMPDQMKDGNCKWVEVLEKAIREQHSSVERIILLLHDKDLSEYSGLKFQCVKYHEKVSIAVFQHPDREVIPFFSGKLSAKEVFETLGAMLSKLSKMRKCNEINAIAQQYKVMEYEAK